MLFNIPQGSPDSCQDDSMRLDDGVMSPEDSDLAQLRSLNEGELSADWYNFQVSLFFHLGFLYHLPIQECCHVYLPWFIAEVEAEISTANPEPVRPGRTQKLKSVPITRF